MSAVRANFSSLAPMFICAVPFAISRNERSATFCGSSLSETIGPHRSWSTRNIRRRTCRKGRAAAFSVAQTGLGLKLQLDLTIASDVSQTEVRREILRAILIEMMYRTNPGLPAGTAYAPPPDWLLDGILPEQSRNEGRLIEILEGRVGSRKNSFARRILAAATRVVGSTRAFALCGLFVRARRPSSSVFSTDGNSSPVSSQIFPRFRMPRWPILDRIFRS